MSRTFTLLLGTLVLAGMARLAGADSGALRLPKNVEAGSAFSIPTAGTGKAVLYIAGPGQVLRRNVELGQPIAFDPGDLHNAGHYLVLLAQGSSTEKAEFDVIAAHQPATLSFLAKPSRLAVDRRDGISGVVYVFDVFRNLVLQPMPVTFQLTDAAGAAQTRTVQTRNGVAWVKMNSAPKAGPAQFKATAASVSDKRVVQQVAGDPCTLRISARPSGQRIVLETQPVRDCTGNAVPDGTIVTFTERYGATEATVDVPLKRGVAKTEMPAYNGAVVSVASGVVVGNEIRWGGGR